MASYGSANASNYPQQSVDEIDLEYRPDNFTISNAAERDLILSLLNPQSNEDLYNVHNHLINSHQKFYTTGPINYSIPNNVSFPPSASMNCVNPNIPATIPTTYYNPTYTPIKSEPIQQQFAYIPNPSLPSPPSTPSDTSSTIVKCR